MKGGCARTANFDLELAEWLEAAAGVEPGEAAWRSPKPKGIEGKSSRREA